METEVEVVEMAHQNSRSRDSLSRKMEELLDTYDSEHGFRSLRRVLENTKEAAEDNMDRTATGSSGLSLSDSFLKYQAKNRPKLSRVSSLLRVHAPSEKSIASSRSSERRFFGRCSPMCTTPSLLALGAGLVSGVAGPGGVLGVIPAVQLRDAKLATIYLSMFCLTSTLVMGGFSAFYGKFSEWLAGGSTGNRVFMVEAWSALLSFAVGIVWLVILSVGKMEEVFP